MCLSTVYKNSKTPEAVLMRNVMSIECRDGMVILTDLMERQMAVEGQLEKANLWMAMSSSGSRFRPDKENGINGMRFKEKFNFIPLFSLQPDFLCGIIPISFFEGGAIRC